MVEMGERELLLRSLKGYLGDLAESGVDELSFVAPSSVEVREARPEQGGSPETVPAAEPVADERLVPSAPVPDCRQEGNPRARLLFLMSGSGFAGRSGELLEKIIQAMTFSRDTVSLVTFPPAAAGEALAACVAERIAGVAPEVVVTMGEDATGLLLEDGGALKKLRGRFHACRGFRVMPTFHPDAMLDDESLKRFVWNDMKLVMAELGQGS